MIEGGQKRPKIVFAHSDANARIGHANQNAFGEYSQGEIFVTRFGRICKESGYDNRLIWSLWISPFFRVTIFIDFCDQIW